jgi:hypothetical protein
MRATLRFGAAAADLSVQNFDIRVSFTSRLLENFRRSGANQEVLRDYVIDIAFGNR